MSHCKPGVLSFPFRCLLAWSKVTAKHSSVLSFPFPLWSSKVHTVQGTARKIRKSVCSLLEHFFFHFLPRHEISPTPRIQGLSICLLYISYYFMHFVALYIFLDSTVAFFCHTMGLCLWTASHEEAPVLLPKLHLLPMNSKLFLGNILHAFEF